MPTASTFALFTLAAMALLLVPGPAVLYVVTRSVEHGRAAGLMSAVGTATGSIVHIAGAAIGISALLVESAALFTAVKLAGALYLIALGVRRLLIRATEERAVPPAQALRRVWAQGVIVNVLNPKTALFFFAFLPQFVDPDRGPAAPQVLVLGALFVVLVLLNDGTYALVASAAARRFRGRPRDTRRLERASGLVLIALGVVAAIARRPVHRSLQPG